MTKEEPTIDRAMAIEQMYLDKYKQLDNVISLGNSPVQQFYNGSVVLVTGGSGFLGKQLIEKLFRSCKLQKMYLLLRPKKETSLQSRLKEILQDPLYEKLHQEEPDFVSRITPVEGNVSKIGLGLHPETLRNITEEVNIIFHGAATVNFVERMTVAIQTNVRGTMEMIKLAKTCSHLKAFVHISTAYSHATKVRTGEVMSETFQRFKESPEYLVHLADTYDHDTLDNLTSWLLWDWPNTYTYTKAAAEEVVRTMGQDLPICVVRPAIVMAACRETLGWTDKSTINGPTGFLMGACLGGLHVMYADTSKNIDMVPVDYVNNASLLAAHETAARRARGDSNIKIYTVALARNPQNMGELYKIVDGDEIRSLISPKIVWYNYCVVTSSKLVFVVLTWLLHFIPGYIADGFLILCGKKPKAIRLLTKAYKMNKLFHHFISNEWYFEDMNLLELFKKQSPEDQVIYECDVAKVNRFAYTQIVCIGCRRYLLKDGLKDTDYAVKKMKFLKVVNVLFFALYFYAIWKVFSFIFSCF